MIELVKQSPRILAVHTADVEAMTAYLLNTFSCVQTEYVTMVMREQFQSIAYVMNEEETQLVKVAIRQTAEAVLGQLLQDDTIANLREEIYPLPPILLIQTEGHRPEIATQIAAEFDCDWISYRQLVSLHNTTEQSVVVCFLESETDDERIIGEQALYIRKSAEWVEAYIRMRIPRYFQVAFPVHAWHMVDIRLFDKSNHYELQRRRLLYAIKCLKLGYVVTEFWNHEISPFSEPVGMIHIRLVTFLDPYELKKLLIGLEYGEAGRIADLDVIWHNKKISWKQLLEQKEIRQQLRQGKTWLPKSSFFAVQEEKQDLIQYCVDEKNKRLSGASSKELLTLERELQQALNA